MLQYIVNLNLRYSLAASGTTGTIIAWNSGICDFFCQERVNQTVLTLASHFCSSSKSMAPLNYLKSCFFKGTSVQ